MRPRYALLAVLVASPVEAAPQKLTLEQAIAKAVRGPKVQVADADTAMAASRLAEAKAAALPRIKATAFGTVSPDIDCLTPDCTRTGPKNFAWDFEGLFGSAQLDFTQPLYTFGKLTHARNAARAGLDAQRALVDEAAGDVAVDTARAYWGVKLARELGYMLDDGIEEIGKAIERMEERTGDEAVSIQDRQRVAVLLAEAKVQRAEALAGEQQGLAGLRALTGVAEADIDDAEYAAVARELPKTADPTNRPQAVAARKGAAAYDELAAMTRSFYFPDIALVGTAVFARAQGADDPPNAYANDIYNREGVGAVIALQWTVEPWTGSARRARAEAEARKARAQSALATAGAQFDADTALAEAMSARAKVTAADDGVKAARAWLASVLQAEAIGTAEPKDLADAYIAWFQMRARWAQAVFQWNVAVVRLGRASGEFHAGTPRP